MASVLFINPMSNESQKILKENVDLDSIFEYNQELVDTLSHIGEGILDDERKFPNSYGKLVLKRIEWYFREKNDKDFKTSEYSYFFNESINSFDVIAFHLCSQAIAFKYNLSSRETKLFLESEQRIIEERLSRVSNEIIENLINETLNELLSNFTYLNWNDILPLIRSKKISLKNLLLYKGEIILDEDEFEEKYYTEMEDWPHRRIEMAFNRLVGHKTKELILTQLIIENTEEYLKNIKEKLQRIQIHPSIEKLSNEIAELLDRLNDKYSKFYGEGGIFGGDEEIGTLNKNAFPPCVNNTIEGVKSGNRNDAIVLFLTSFISYGRLNPQVFRRDTTTKISDFDPDLKITTEEILPIIHEAANNAVPPLFEDQPQEKINIVSKLGFGMHDDIKIENEGQTKWYTPMSCDKVKLHLTNLCKPDKVCKKIGNPLSYYSYKKWLIKNKNKEDDE
ncbi:MAG: DNA primase [Methanobrevibacter sp.]|jgi:DNA primase large subunit|nr:DNA primase [Candidatus Methanovirga aequatorialis]